MRSRWVRAIVLTGMVIAGGAAHAACDRQDFVLAIDVGHSIRDPGAISARGVPEYSYNKNLAHRLVNAATAAGFDKAFLINPADQVLGLQERARIARKKGADLLLSIHHDSMRASLLKRWHFQGAALRYGDQYHGHSIFYSERNDDPDDSREFAILIGEKMRERGLTPTLHHDGVGKRHLVNRTLGIYRYDPLILLHSASMPAVLFEAGIILNRDEELALRQGAYQDKLIEGLISAVDDYCALN